MRNFNCPLSLKIEPFGMNRCELRTFDLRKISLYILTCILTDFSQMFTILLMTEENCRFESIYAFGLAQMKNEV